MTTNATTPTAQWTSGDTEAQEILQKAYDLIWSVKAQSPSNGIYNPSFKADNEVGVNAVELLRLIEAVSEQIEAPVARWFDNTFPTA